MCKSVVFAELTCVFQGEDDEKTIVYNTVGTNVCMGDHKVRVGENV